MTPTQQKYLANRLSQIANERVCALGPQGLSKEDKATLFARGEFEVYEQHGCYYVRFLEDLAKTEEYDKQRKLIQKEKQELMDKIMLDGQGAEISAALEAFANK